MLSIQWNDEQLHLYHDRAVCWSRTRTLIIADAHFGKDASFRALGVPVPDGTTAADLARLSALIESSKAERLIILGDFLHAARGRSEYTMSQLAQWRTAHGQLEVILVRGNHDQHAGDPPEDWNFKCVDEPWIDGPFAFAHDPGVARDHNNVAPAQTCFAGHVHPCAILHDIDGSTVRLPCFHFTPTVAILPAFGGFTGMHPVRPRSGDQVFAVSADMVIRVPLIPRRARKA